MDAILRNLQREAYAGEDIEAWRNYAHALERVNGFAPKKLFAVLNDGSTYHNYFSAGSFVEYNADDSAELLYKKFMKKNWRVPQCEVCMDFALMTGFYDECGECEECEKYDQHLDTHECNTDILLVTQCLASEAWIIDEQIAFILEKASEFLSDNDPVVNEHLEAALKYVCQKTAIETITLEYPYQK